MASAFHFDVPLKYHSLLAVASYEGAVVMQKNPDGCIFIVV